MDAVDAKGNALMACQLNGARCDRSLARIDSFERKDSHFDLVNLRNERGPGCR